MATFTDLGISKAFDKALKENNIIEPTAIQEQTIPFLLGKGSDFIGQAQTGTGKTAAFGLPILHKINPANPVVQALILAPTRELCQQIAKQLFRFTKYSEKIFVEAVYGGAPIGKQMANLKRPTHIIVATPGRLIDLVDKKALDLKQVKCLVLDEADEMLSMGFKNELEKILKRTAKGKYTWLFSATMPAGIRDIISTYMAKDAHSIVIDPEHAINKNIKHQYLLCDYKKKSLAIQRFVESQKGNKGVVFCNTKKTAIELSEELKGANFRVDALHGDLNQKERDKVLRAIKSDRIQVLIATDVAARGIDIKNLAFVIHHQLPTQMEYFTHRSGRTARAGQTGISLILATDNEAPKIQEISRDLGIKVNERSF